MDGGEQERDAIARAEAEAEAAYDAPGDDDPPSWKEVFERSYDSFVHSAEPMWRYLFGVDLRRMWLGFRSNAGPLDAYYRKDYGTHDLPWTEVEYLAIDIEATGLDPAEDEILSVGYVPIINGRIHLSQAGYHLIRPRRSIPEKTAVVHGILDDHLEEAPRLGEVMPRVLEAMAGRVPVAHHARLERFFLSRACRQTFGQPLEVPFVDTMQIEKRTLARQGTELKRGDLRLPTVRERYGLPRYRAHNALLDAIAAAEVMLVQADRLSGRKAARLDSLLT